MPVCLYECFLHDILHIIFPEKGDSFHISRQLIFVLPYQVFIVRTIICENERNNLFVGFSAVAFMFHDAL